MPSYKLTYFNGRGRAELIRLIFVEAGVKYEDCRIERESWPALKPTTPWESLPILEVDGQVIGQSVAVARYVANQVGLSSKDHLKQAKADAVVDTLVEVMDALGRIMFSSGTEQEKAEAFKNVFETTVTSKFNNIEKLLKNNKGGKGYLVGDKMTWADLAVFNMAYNIRQRSPEFLESFSLLKGLVKRVEERPKIAKWLAARPETPF